MNGWMDAADMILPVHECRVLYTLVYVICFGVFSFSLRYPLRRPLVHALTTAPWY